MLGPSWNTICLSGTLCYWWVGLLIKDCNKLSNGNLIMSLIRLLLHLTDFWNIFSLLHLPWLKLFHFALYLHLKCLTLGPVNPNQLHVCMFKIIPVHLMLTWPKNSFWRLSGACVDSYLLGAKMVSLLAVSLHLHLFHFIMFKLKIQIETTKI